MALVQGYAGHDIVTIAVKGTPAKLSTVRIIVYECEIAALDSNLQDVYLGIGPATTSSSYARRLRPGDSWEKQSSKPIDLSDMWINNHITLGNDGDGVTVFKPADVNKHASS